MSGNNKVTKIKKINEEKSNDLKDQIKTFVKEDSENDEMISDEELEKIKKIANEGGLHGLYGCTIC
jgi:hypothetical protein